MHTSTGSVPRTGNCIRLIIISTPERCFLQSDYSVRSTLSNSTWSSLRTDSLGHFLGIFIIGIIKGPSSPAPPLSGTLRQRQEQQRQKQWVVISSDARANLYSIPAAVSLPPVLTAFTSFFFTLKRRILSLPSPLPFLELLQIHSKLFPFIPLIYFMFNPSTYYSSR